MALGITIYHNHRVASLGYGVFMWQYEKVSKVSARYVMDALIVLRFCMIYNSIIGIMQCNKCDIYNVRYIYIFRYIYRKMMACSHP